ncbi:MAG: hypothetical protein AAF329_20265 [Cyanobacteria bacterium P01_A01_bin.17]
MLRQAIFIGVLLFQAAMPVRGQTVQPQTLESFPEVGVSLEPPEGFEKAPTFYGVQQPETGASIMVSAIPGPYAEVVKGFNSQRLATRGLRLLSQQSLGDGSRLLLKVSQRAYGQDFLKWLVVFADQQNQTKVVVATFPEDAADRLSAPLKEAALSAALIPQSAEARVLPFRIKPSAQLVEVKELQGSGKVLAFSKDGVAPAQSPSDPLFIVAPSLGAVPVLDRKMFALRRLEQFSQIQEIEVEKVDAIAINNQVGFEIIANAKDSQSQVPLRIYQAMLFPEEGGYVVMIGIVGQDDAAQYMPEFQLMANTYEHLP